MSAVTATSQAARVVVGDYIDPPSQEVIELGCKKRCLSRLRRMDWRVYNLACYGISGLLSYAGTVLAGDSKSLIVHIGGAAAGFGNVASTYFMPRSAPKDPERTVSHRELEAVMREIGALKSENAQLKNRLEKLESKSN